MTDWSIYITVTTSIRSHQRSNFEQPINYKPIILWGIEKNKSFWREGIFSEKNNMHPQPPTQYSLHKYWVWIFKNLWFHMQKCRVHGMIYQPIGSSNIQWVFSVVARLGLHAVALMSVLFRLFCPVSRRYKNGSLFAFYCWNNIIHLNFQPMKHLCDTSWNYSNLL